jgi:RimK family alpha-L-glutamate ligase
VAVVGGEGSDTNLELVAAWHALGLDVRLVLPSEVGSWLRPGDIALGRLDVLPTLDGVEPGLLELLRLERRGVPVLNPASALAGAHDKLLTARLLARAGLPHPPTAHLRPGGEMPRLEPPLVVKPRHGSWGVDVFRCDTEEEVHLRLLEIEARQWFRRHGALIQELVEPRGHDLRLVVAGGVVIGAAERLAAPGEWRTNVSLGGTPRETEAPSLARALGVAAAAAIGADLVGVDLLPTADGYTVLELNGAVDFNDGYARPGHDIFVDAAGALGLPVPAAVAAVRA